MKVFSRHSAGLVAAVACWLAPKVANAEIVFNGGFESGNFSGWSVPPSIPNQSLFFVSGGSAHAGMYYGRLSSTQLQFVSQVLPTVAGTDYELSFWLRTAGPALSETFTVRWEGQVVFAEFVGGIDPLPWTRFTMPLQANITGSFLEFGQTIFPFEYHIDDISVVAVPAPGAAAVVVMGGAFAARRRRR